MVLSADIELEETCWIEVIHEVRQVLARTLLSALGRQDFPVAVIQTAEVLAPSTVAATMPTDAS